MAASVLIRQPIAAGGF
ncbi:SAM-dependent methyltransferase domain protein, partial [Vibrio cholerae BJG-01]